MYILLTLVSIISCWIICLYLPFKERTILKHIVESNNIFCIQYLVFSCLFLIVENFAVWKPLVMLIVCNGITIIFLWIKRYQQVTLSNMVKVCKEEIQMGILIFCVILPFIHTTTEDISTVSDQGAYFLHTMLLMEEKNEQVHKIQELGIISEEVDEGLKELQEELPIYYYDEEGNYDIHALNTWCIFPALFGKMFGKWKCMKAVNYLFLLTVMNMFYICKKLSKNRMNIYIFMGMFALSPLVLYIGKAGLSEIAILLFFVMGLGYLLEESDLFSVISGLCIGCVGFIHLSMYMYIPIITAMAVLESVKKKKFIYFNVMQLALFGLSIWYAYIISPIYVERQYARFTLNGRISYLWLFLLIDLVVLICIGVQFYIYRSQITWFETIRAWILKHFKLIAALIWGVIIMYTVYNAYCIGFTEKFAIPEGYDAGSWNLRSRYVGTGIQAISYLSIINIARATGGIGLLVVFLLPFMQKKLTDKVKFLYFLMIYTVLVFTVVQVDIPFNYYASRYFVPFLVPLMVIIIVSSISSKNWAFYILMVTILFNKSYWYAFPQGAPQRGQYSILQDAMNIIPVGSVVLADIESEFMNTRLSSNLRILNENRIYNLDNYQEVAEYYSDENIYVLSGRRLEGVGDLIWYDVYVCQYSFGNGKNGSYAKEIGTYTEGLYIYKK